MHLFYFAKVFKSKLHKSLLERDVLRVGLNFSQVKIFSENISLCKFMFVFYNDKKKKLKYILLNH